MVSYILFKMAPYYKQEHNLCFTLLLHKNSGMVVWNAV